MPETIAHVGEAVRPEIPKRPTAYGFQCFGITWAIHAYHDSSVRDKRMRESVGRGYTCVPFTIPGDSQ